MKISTSQKLIQLAIHANGNPVADLLPDVKRDRRQDDRALVEKSIKEGLAGFLFRYQKKSDAACQLTEQEKQRLEQTYYGGVQKNLRLLQALSEIAEQIKPHDLRVVLLQGISLLDSVYTDIGLRVMTDIDLWVLPENFPSFKDCLLHLGYRSRAPYPQVFVRGNTCIDVHTHLLWAERIQARSSLLHIDQKDIFYAAEGQALDGGTVYRLSPADQFIYLSLHCLKHYAQRLIWLIDLVFLVRRWIYSDWVELHRRARELGHTRTVQYILFLLKDLAEYQPPQDCSEMFCNTSLKTWEKGILQIRKKKDRLPAWAPLVLLPANLGLSQKMRFISENLFPEPQVLRQIFSSESKLKNWQLYGLRVLQLLGLKKQD